MHLGNPNPLRIQWWGGRTLRHETDRGLGNVDVCRCARLSPGCRPEYLIWTTLGECQADKVVPGLLLRHSCDFSTNPLRDILTGQTNPDLPGVWSFLPQRDQSPICADVSELYPCRAELSSIPPTQAGQVSGGGVPQRAATIRGHVRTPDGVWRKSPLVSKPILGRPWGECGRDSLGLPAIAPSSRSLSRNSGLQSGSRRSVHSRFQPKLFGSSAFLIAPSICQRLQLLTWSNPAPTNTLGAYNARNRGSLPDSDAAGSP